MPLKLILFTICLLAAISANAQRAKVYSFVTQPPSFPGGEVALAAYLTKNIKYKVSESEIVGTATVQFIIDTLGCVYNIKPRDTTKTDWLHQELIRVVSMMPAWNPGMHNGRKVAVQYYLPLYICLPME
ncbi:energy transducer TonB [Chitinophaga arvensicola]|uniref:TonB protein C-terminal n=1 Tax=Chitinophaga arvensicola TaxID=29529 RepID=A0A1I0QIX7_9BACT|nr:energy transducer TonB [Chitinophaga arvensicola]SEW26921.1 TonB protein C-terminal [Chitinophaga arvensicola]